jgi:hypothetical protein
MKAKSRTAPLRSALSKSAAPRGNYNFRSRTWLRVRHPPDDFVVADEVDGVEFFGAAAQLELGRVGGKSEGAEVDAPEGLVGGGFGDFYF